jgi:hypothetical protein
VVIVKGDEIGAQRGKNLNRGVVEHWSQVVGLAFQCDQGYGVILIVGENAGGEANLAVVGRDLARDVVGGKAGDVADAVHHRLQVEIISNRCNRLVDAAAADVDAGQLDAGAFLDATKLVYQLPRQDQFVVTLAVEVRQHADLVDGDVVAANDRHDKHGTRAQKWYREYSEIQHRAPFGSMSPASMIAMRIPPLPTAYAAGGFGIILHHRARRRKSRGASAGCDSPAEKR